VWGGCRVVVLNYHSQAGVRKCIPKVERFYATKDFSWAVFGLISSSSLFLPTNLPFPLKAFQSTFPCSLILFPAITLNDVSNSALFEYLQSLANSLS